MIRVKIGDSSKSMIWTYLITRVKYHNDDYDNECRITMNDYIIQQSVQVHKVQERRYAPKLAHFQCKSNQRGKDMWWIRRQHSCLYVNGGVSVCVHKE